MKGKLTELYKSEADKHLSLSEYKDNALLLEILELIENNQNYYITNRLQPNSPLARKLMQDDIVAKERGQAGHHFNHINLTVNPPKKMEGQYSYQICLPPPHCVRLLINFVNKQPRITINTQAIEKKPDTSKIFASHGDVRVTEVSETKVTLKQTIELLDSIKLQRIAVVGFARNAPDFNPKDTRKRNYLELKTISLHQHRALYASIQLDAFLNTLKDLHIPLTTVGGGWAGQKSDDLTPRTVGVPFLSHLYGIEDESKIKTKMVESKTIEVKSGTGSPHLSFFPSLTVMPSKGTADSVDTEAGTPEFNAILKKQDNFAENTVGYRSQFIFAGEWGDESPYLAALSTAMVVIEPAGRWTQIEMLNAMEQGFPVVILASPENYDEKWMSNFTQESNKINPYYQKLAEGAKFIEIDFPTPSDAKAKVRAYKNPADAALYLAKTFIYKEIKDDIFQQYLESTTGQQRLLELISRLKEDSSLVNSKNLMGLPDSFKVFNGRSRRWLCDLQKVTSQESISKVDYGYNALLSKASFTVSNKSQCSLTLGRAEDVPEDIRLLTRS